MATQQTQNKKTMEGVVASDKMDKTVVVLVDRYVRHQKYGKYYRISKKFKAHDPQNIYAEGMRVRIEESRPHAKEKAFRVVGEVTK